MKRRCCKLDRKKIILSLTVQIKGIKGRLLLGSIFFTAFDLFIGSNIFPTKKPLQRKLEGFFM